MSAFRICDASSRLASHLHLQKVVQYSSVYSRGAFENLLSSVSAVFTVVLGRGWVGLMPARARTIHLRLSAGNAISIRGRAVLVRTLIYG